jgi:Holliday junction resolvase
MSSASTAHNQALRKEVEDLEERGWDVDADHLSGYDRPAKIESTTQDRIPDIEATKKGGRRIVEIKRQKNNWKIRSDQVKTFNRSVNRRENTRFYGRLIDEEGKRVESFGNPPGSILDPRHRKGVLREARDLECDGWNVQADIKGPQFERPPTLGRKWPYTPDIYATKHGHTRVVEIETNSNRGEKKRKTFWRHVGQKNNCVFYWRIVDAEGRRRKSRGNYPGDVL